MTTEAAKATRAALVEELKRAIEAHPALAEHRLLTRRFADRLRAAIENNFAHQRDGAWRVLEVVTVEREREELRIADWQRRQAYFDRKVAALPDTLTLEEHTIALEDIGPGCMMELHYADQRMKHLDDLSAAALREISEKGAPQ